MTPAVRESTHQSPFTPFLVRDKGGGMRDDPRSAGDASRSNTGDRPRLPFQGEREKEAGKTAFVSRRRHFRLLPLPYPTANHARTLFPEPL